MQIFSFRTIFVSIELTVSIDRGYFRRKQIFRIPFREFRTAMYFSSSVKVNKALILFEMATSVFLKKESNDITPIS